MIKPPEQINIEEFKYFIVVEGLMVAGVYAEDEENIYCITLKGDAAPIGSVTSNTKKNVADQVEEGIAFIVKMPEEAMAFDVTNAITNNVADFINKKKEDGDE
jgi:hypothetical protein